jgi:hypothetical protein
MRKTAAALLVLAATPAQAQLLDTPLPANAVPGYGTPFSVVTARRAQAPGATIWGLGGVSLAPSLTMASGYDTAPNGGAASPLASATPSLLLADPVAGFGAYAAASASLYPADTRQNTQSLALAAGERLQLARDTLTFSAAYLRAAATGFALETSASPKPLAYTLTDLRAADEISAPTFTLTPDIDARLLTFPGLALQNRRDTRETLLLRSDGDGILAALLRLRATQSLYRTGGLDSATQSALAGLTDTQDGLWTLSLLAGAAWRQTAHGPPLTAPVLEAGADWAPDADTQLRLTVAREIDDPDDISATPYTLTQARLAVTSGAPGCLTLSARLQAETAAYWRTAERETLYTVRLGAAWPLSPLLALNGDYTFNDRQSNTQGAANEHVLTLGLTWTP